jgi:hypothetical protein
MGALLLVDEFVVTNKGDETFRDCFVDDEIQHESTHTACLHLGIVANQHRVNEVAVNQLIEADATDLLCGVSAVFLDQPFSYPCSD